ncbi:bestrophin [Rhizobium grahamii]|uniref:Bestrophin n=1 Tax=Rhizobium grahamii TaxID=1120045 RepID=A0A5Q0C611_9HYPH|nr:MULTISPECIES: bestrophin family protein [Rhizobium]QFY59430.1 bestrophin [Rhizobium grahamii]QRM48043.1 bestrophin [Rhizobium sp. BG6]
MIVRPRPSLLKLFFILRGSIIKQVFPQILLTGFLSSLVVLVHSVWPGTLPVFSGAPFALLGIAISIFLGFRNNACYDRWWEARKQWGQMIFSARHFARQTLLLETASGEAGAEARRRLVTLVIAFIQSLVPHLRAGSGREKVEHLLSPELKARYHASRTPPEAISLEIARELADLRARGMLTDISYQILDKTLGELTLAQASCERIRWTPVPFGYTLLLHRTAHLFCLLLPFGFDDVLGWFMPFATALVAYTFFGLDALGDELEAPFGNQPNALPIGALADTIEINLREALGETDLPPLPTPVDYLLM